MSQNLPVVSERRDVDLSNETVQEIEPESAQKRFFRRLSDYKLSFEEREAIEKAKQSARSKSAIGGFALGTAGLLFSRQRNFGFGRTALISMSLALLGSQAGYIFGVQQGTKYLEGLPNSNLKRIFEDFKNDIKREKLGIPTESPSPSDSSSPWSESSDIDMTNETPFLESTSTSNSGYYANARRNASSSSKESDHSAWDHIREEQRKANSTTWDRLRYKSTPSATPVAIADSSEERDEKKISTWDVIRSREGVDKYDLEPGPTQKYTPRNEDFARTREDEERQKAQITRTNKYGDVMS